MADQFISVITDEAMAKANYEKGWVFKPYMFAITEKDILGDMDESEIFDDYGEVTPAAFNVLKEFQTKYFNRESNEGNIWFQAPFSLSRATDTTITHHIIIPGDTSIDTASKQIKTIFFLYKDNYGQVYLHAIARSTNILVFERGLTQSFFFNFTVANSTAQNLIDFVVNYSYPQEIEAHNISTDAHVHDYLMSRDGVRLATGIFEYNQSFTFTKPNQLITKQYVDDIADVLRVEIKETVCPPGTLRWWPGDRPPNENWAIRNGQLLLIEENPELFKLLGHKYANELGTALANFDRDKYFRIMNDQTLFIRGCQFAKAGDGAQSALATGTGVLANIKFGGKQNSAVPNISGTHAGTERAQYGNHKLNVNRSDGKGCFYVHANNGAMGNGKGVDHDNMVWGLDASRCSKVYQNGVDEARPISRNYLPIIRLG